MINLSRLLRKYREGVHFANPVFDGANEGDIERFLDLQILQKMQEVSCLMVVLVTSLTIV